MLHIILLANHLLLQVAAQVSFSYPGFKENTRNDFILSGNASISTSQLHLTSDNFFSYGRAVKTQAITFCAGNTPLSFTSDFTFLIRNEGNTQRADGLAFFIAPSTRSPSNQSFGGWLALMEPSDNGKPSNHLVAVEFDTFQNRPPEYPGFQDIDANHVGVNVNGIISQNASSLTPSGIVLGGDSVLAARIDYDARVQKLRVYVSRDQSFGNTGSPVLEHSINICAYITDTSYLGFSAGAGVSGNFHSINTWSFNSYRSKSSGGQKKNCFRTPFFIALGVAGILLLCILCTFLLSRVPEKWLY